MEKNFYEILEVDKNASPEIIKKAYSTLAKKYHPDLQPDDKKYEAEMKFKIINEAYETLSDEEKRANYDSQLQQQTISKEDYNFIYEENQQLKNIINELQNERNNFINNIENNPSNNTNNDLNQNIQENNTGYSKNYYDDYENALKSAYNQAYHDAYIQDLRNRGYKIRYKKTFKDYVKNTIALLLTIFIIWLLWQIPFVQKIIKENILFNLLLMK